MIVPNLKGGGGGQIGQFQGVILHVLEIKKIYWRLINNVNLSVLKLKKTLFASKWGNQSLQFFLIIHQGANPAKC